MAKRTAGGVVAEVRFAARMLRRHPGSTLAAAVGREMTFRLPPLAGLTSNPRVVGIVSDVRFHGLDAPPTAALYVPWRVRATGVGFLVRSNAAGSDLAAALRDVARAPARIASPEGLSVLRWNECGRRAESVPRAVRGASRRVTTCFFHGAEHPAFRPVPVRRTASAPVPPGCSPRRCSPPPPRPAPRTRSPETASSSS